MSNWDQDDSADEKYQIVTKMTIVVNKYLLMVEGIAQSIFPEVL